MITALIFALSACGGNKSGNGEIKDRANISALNDPTGWGLVKIKTDRAYAYNTEFCDTADEIIAKLKNGETDIATLPLDEAAKVYNETNGAVKALAVSSSGCFHILSSDREIKTLADLSGRKLYISETEKLERRTLDYLLGKTDFKDGKGPEIITLKNDEEVVAKALGEKNDTYALPVFYAAEVLAKEDGVGQVLSLKREWDLLHETSFTLGIILVRAEYAGSHPEMIENLRNFADVSLNYVADNSTAGKELLDEGIFDDSTVAKKIIPGCYFGYIDGEEMKESVSLCLSELYSGDASAIGGKLPDDGFYMPAG